MSRSLLFFVLSTLFARHAGYGQGRTYAVVVGIADYKIGSYRNGDLRYADSDARQVNAFLKSAKGGNVPVTHIRQLLNAQATYRAVIQATSLFGQAKPADRVLLYFSGHGQANGFLPYDVQPGRANTVLTYEIIKAAFRRSRATTKLCIADACLSGGMTQSASAQTRAVASNLSAGTNVAMLLASRATQPAVEDGRRAGGTFTYYLLKGLQGLADRDADHIVTIRELHAYVSPRVGRATGGRQSPVFYGHFPDTMPMSYL